MVRYVFRNSGKLFSTVLSIICIFGFSTAAFAQMAGCDPLVWTALKAKAEAQVAYDTAVTRQMINKPDSVLTLTCFDQAAGVSANKGGAIFSGDFTTSLKTVMTVNGGGAFTCTAIGDLWKLVTDEGIETGAPYATFDDLINGTAPTSSAAGDDFTAGWTAATSANVFSKLNTAVTALPAPTTLDFAAARSSCDVLSTAGISSGSCP